MELKPDLVQGWMYHGNVAASMAVVGDRLPVVWGIHHSLHDVSGEKLLTRLLIYSGRRLARQAKLRKIVYCSDASRLQHEAIGYPSSKSLYIPNGFDCGRFVPSPQARQRVRQELQLSDAALLVGSAARFHPVKNHIGLIHAFSSIAARHPDARLLLAGRDLTPSNKPLMAAIRRGGQGGRVILLGERDDIPEFFAALDILVLSSRSEGFPNVLGEAMACGVPCVTTDVGDAALIVGDTGMAVPADNDAALAAALSAVLALPASQRKTLGARARSRVLGAYSMATVAARYADLYRDVHGRT
jgi:glycosyltransferase involved in cell wall biosynthesis